ncbi:MAG: cobalt ECF transporter T component CbiQ, partial [Planctomycetes bacterium]|nr:cobalt ECF transporter T component CbiQ [Planctomycetota bacterium]
RYIFLLAREASRMARAYALRALAPRRMDMRAWVSLVGHLLLRAYDRGERVHSAMLCRGFSGELPVARPSRFAIRDAFFVAVCLSFFALVRFGHVPQQLGDLLLRWCA